MRQFLQDKDWSHIIAHVNGGSNEANNGIFESSQINRARGGVDMTLKELNAAKQVQNSAAFKASVIQITKGVLQGAVAAAAVELVFSILENSQLYLEGKITQDELIEKVFSDTAQAGVTGGIITGILFTISMIYPPIAALLSAVAIPLTAAGVGFMSKRAWDIWLRWVDGGNVSSSSVQDKK